MQKIITFSFTINLLLMLLLSFIYITKASPVIAQEYPVPSPTVPCDATRFPEHNSLRPYQASPCYQEKDDIALFCGNSLFLPFPVESSYGDSSMQSCDPPSGNSVRCYFEKLVEVDNLDILMTGVKLPIMGYTEDGIVNSTKQADTIDDKDKVNQYVSWYLNGVTGRAEYLPLEMDTTEEEDERKLLDEDERKVIELSGPLKKLLPWDIQILKRTQTIARTPQIDKGDISKIEHDPYKVDNIIDESGNPKLARHDQVIGCVASLLDFFVWRPVWGFPPWKKVRITIGSVPVPCYADDESSKPVRLSEYVTSNKLPPLREEYAEDDLATYLEHYKEWRGKFCTVIEIPAGFPVSFLQGKKILLCFDDPTNIVKPEFYANFWDNIPFSTTEDRLGEASITSSAVQPGSEDMTISNVVLQTTSADLFFPHMQEVDELADILQDTYVAQDVKDDKATPAEDSKVSGLYCDIANVRTGLGDNLFPTSDGDWPGGIKIDHLEFLASYHCDFGIDYDEYGDPYVTSTKCDKSAIVSLDTITKTPLANEVWARLVDGEQSVFKRFYPQIDEGAPIDKILDIPASSTVTYERSDGGSINVRGPDGSSSSPEIYFPHIGGIQEYFLEGIQTALRPKGMGSGPLSGNLLPPGTIGSGTCSEGTGECSVENLLPYFGNDVVAATKASQICNLESGSSPTAKNLSCLTGGSVDFSIGLFQINLLAHCADAFTGYTWTPPSCSIQSDGTNCTDIDPRITTCNKTLKQCLIRFLNPAQNIDYAVGLSRNGTSWGAWKTASEKCGF